MKIKRMLTAALLSCTLLLTGCSQLPISLFGNGESSVKESSVRESSVKEDSDIESSDTSSEEKSKAPDADKHYIQLMKNETYSIPSVTSSMKFSSKDEAVASVNASGLVTAVSEGKTEITVSLDGEVTDTYIVTVTKSTYEESLPSAPESIPGDENRITPAVWEVTDRDGNTAYMMGSIHVGDTDTFYMPDYYNAALGRCSALAVECDTSNVDISLWAEYMDDYLYTDGTKIYDHISEEAYNNAKAILVRYDQYSSQADYYKPMLWSEYLELCAAEEAGLSSDYGVDNILMADASKKGKQILELESVEFQMQLLTGFDDKLQEEMLEEFADPDAYDSYVTEMEELYEHWKTGTLNAEEVGAEIDYSEILSESMTPEERAEAEEYIKLYEDYNKKMLDDRNVGMESKIKGYMKEGKVVMTVVGAGHFYGEKGILSLLEKDGCTIKQLTTADTKRLKTRRLAA